MIEIILDAGNYKFVIDGEPLLDSAVIVQNNSLKQISNEVYANRFYVEVYPLPIETGAIQRIIAHKIDDVPSYLDTIEFKAFTEFERGFYVAVFVSFTDKNVTISIAPDFERWKRLWSIAEYNKEFTRIASNEEQMEVPYNRAFYYRALVKASAENWDTSCTIAETVERLVSRVQIIHELAVNSLNSRLYEDSVVAHFDFPESVKVPCEQYLQYFVQFLKDAGVGATADITHEAGRVLFSITPDDKEVALDRIRQALMAYLSLPSNPSIATTPFYGQPPQVQQLLANVQHLNGQLMMASAALQLKEAMIQTQQVEIDRWRGTPITPTVLIDSLVPEPKEKDKVSLFWNTVDVTDLELKGVTIKLPEIYRRLQLPNFFQWLGNALVEIEVPNADNQPSDTTQIGEPQVAKQLSAKADTDDETR